MVGTTLLAGVWAAMALNVASFSANVTMRDDVQEQGDGMSLDVGVGVWVLLAAWLLSALALIAAEYLDRRA